MRLISFGGGGGYGSPLDRPAEQIESDLREGYITRERAESCYGICFDDAGLADAARTTEHRRALRANGEFSARVASMGSGRDVTEGGLSEGEASADRFLTQGRLFSLRCC